MFWKLQKGFYICTRIQQATFLNLEGTLAQLVEQWTENPCVPGSIPGGTTKKPLNRVVFLFVLFQFYSFFEANSCFIFSISLAKSVYFLLSSSILVS